MHKTDNDQGDQTLEDPTTFKKLFDHAQTISKTDGISLD